MALTFLDIALAGVLAAVMWVARARTFGVDRSAKLPPIVKYKWPILGSTFDFIKDPAAFTRTAYREYGPVFRVYFRGHVQAVVGKDHVRDIFLNPAFSYEEAVNDEFHLADMLGTSQTDLEPHKLFAVIITPLLSRFIPILSNMLTRGLDIGIESNLRNDAPLQIANPSDLVMDVIARATTVCFFGEVTRVFAFPADERH
ncbi:hypothetical protein GLOTRDRAFT_132015 [Gloeophyllum trabeum ATCC 11539]|uniref:Cytochrome P450 n=1 Tax=Gloeophyllum trabeum (strain ATCC 11539 / FP-39264 / Madison 617) TaxID=670483 RepID=S7PZ63_GLOTA|nr:uncharacterized protein GLOTRDRAFT_132015 [Gloeophyllum trabeum ATCC 11539]EPQ52778.1 hypothetical protein GLOTRDRAFT_132015 [Gloeophyllum trabeum ATCC 11539]